jgi:hypothetical protein
MALEKPANSAGQLVVWECNVADLLSGKADIIVTGEPKIVAAPYGNSVWFDGAADSIHLKENPVKGLDSFTIEILIKPDFKGPAEQRFLHIGEINGDRVLVETRVTPEGQWYLDTYIQSGQSQKTLIDPGFMHPIGKWYHVALTLDDQGRMKNYINGKFEIEGWVDFTRLNSGEMSVGVRRNKVSWYKGTICKIRISQGALKPESFMSF